MHLVIGSGFHFKKLQIIMEQIDNKEELYFLDSKELYVVYILSLGQDHDGYNTYQFLIAKDSSEVWGEDWNEKPAGNCRFLTPTEDMYDYVKELKTNIILDLAQDNACFSMQDCRDSIIPLAYENLDQAEEYPENGRIVIHFGDTLYNAELQLARRDLNMKFI